MWLHSTQANSIERKSQYANHQDYYVVRREICVHHDPSFVRAFSNYRLWHLIVSHRKPDRKSTKTKTKRRKLQAFSSWIMKCVNNGYSKFLFILSSLHIHHLSLSLSLSVYSFIHSFPPPFFPLFHRSSLSLSFSLSLFLSLSNLLIFPFSLCFGVLVSYIVNDYHYRNGD